MQQAFCKQCKTSTFILLGCCLFSGLIALGVYAQENALSENPAQQSRPTDRDWPIAPKSDSSVPLIPTSRQPIVAIEALTLGPPPTDPVQSASEQNYRGTLVYTPSLQIGKPRAQQYWVLRQLGADAGQTSTVVHYPGETDGRVWDPQMSPDGKTLLFKLALDPLNFRDAYSVFLWNFQAKRLTQMQAPANLQFRWLRWSPDSRYIAFVSDGDRFGRMPAHSKTPKLHIYDVQSGKQRLIVENPQVTRMAWTHQGTLLFTMAVSKLSQGSTNQSEKTGVAIYEVNAQGGEPKRIIDNGFYPQPSSDGKWIAYVAPSLLEQSGNEPNDGQEVPTTGKVVNGRISRGVGFYLWNRQTGKRVLVGPADVSSYCWTPDSQHLVTLFETYKAIGQGKKVGEGVGAIRQVDVPSLRSRDVAVLKANDHEPLPRSEIWPQFEPQVSKDGKTLFVKQSEFIAEEADYQTEVKTLLAVDLPTGKTQTLAKLINRYTNVIGWDFHQD